MDVQFYLRIIVRPYKFRINFPNQIGNKNGFAIFSGAVAVGSKGGLMVPGAVWAVTVDVWAVAASMWDVTVSMWAVTSSM